MKFVAISDTHGWHRKITLPRGDVLIHAGDLTHKGKKEEVIDFLNWFGKQKFLYKIFIAGNHDFYFDQAGEEDIHNLIPEGVTYLNDSGIVIDGINIWGSPVTPWFYNWAFNRHRGSGIRKHWDKIPPGTDLLITHGPPFGFLDCLVSEQHVGCQDLLRMVLTLQPRYHIFGHIHESFGSLKRSGITYINASQVNEMYEPVARPIAFEMK